MSAIKSNKLIPLLAIVALTVIGFIALKASNSDAPTENALDPVATTESGSGGLLGAVRDAEERAKLDPSAEADTPAETLKTLTADIRAARAEMQRLTELNRTQSLQQALSPKDREELKQELLKELKALDPAPIATPTATPTAASTPTLDAPQSPLDPATLTPVQSLTSNFPRGFGFDDLAMPTSPASNAGGSVPGSGQARTVLPMGVTIDKGPDGKDTLIHKTAGVSVARQGANSSNVDMLSDRDVEKKPKDIPYFTIPENATLMGVTGMTAIVGRIPVDGNVTDPMQFKAIIGPENLAANGHFLPADLAGIIVSGIAIGDLNLQCSEGLVQSLTFVFNDGTIQTVSQRQDGATSSTLGGGGGGLGGGGGSRGLAAASKLGYISDRYGNPCISGRFVTNAPAYLTDSVALRTLSIAGQAYAQAQTTVTNSTGMGSTAQSSQVTGDIGKYVLGKSVGGATDEVSSWLMRRLGQSFDAIVTSAGADLVVNIDQEIPIDKRVDARRLDYGRFDSQTTSPRGQYHGLH